MSSSSLSELKSKLNANFTAGSGGSFHRDVVAGAAVAYVDLAEDGDGLRYMDAGLLFSKIPGEEIVPRAEP